MAIYRHLRALRVVTRTGIENLGALFVTCRDVQKSPKIRHFRTIHKNPFALFLLSFCTLSGQIADKISDIPLYNFRYGGYKNEKHS